MRVRQVGDRPRGLYLRLRAAGQTLVETSLSGGGRRGEAKAYNSRQRRIFRLVTAQESARRSFRDCKNREKLTENERGAHDLVAVPRRDHRDSAALEVPAKLAKINQPILLGLGTAELVDEGISAEEVERVAEPSGAGGVDREHVAFVGSWTERGREGVQLEFAA